MSDSIRIRTTPNGDDKYLKVKLEQDFDFIEVLSLKISQEDAYRKFCSDYGVIVGRVSINNGFGVPNAKVSVFIPIDEVDKQNPEIKGLYPYETVNDKNSDGVRYNLLPVDSDSQDACFTPIGSFRNKRELLDNDTLLQVYCKYYKFTTTTNHAGDFMIFGVPLGTYTVHVDADISDIGIATQKPYDLISQGTPVKFFDSSTKFRAGTNLDKLPQIKTLNSGVNVQPFWGDLENCEVGITRLDFDLNYTIRPSAIFMGSIFGDSEKHSVNKFCRPRKALGELCEQVTAAGSIDMIRKTIDGDIEEFSVDGGRVIDDDGTWAYQIPMNLDYMVTNEDGTLSLSDDPNKGIPTRASVRFKIGMDETGGEGRLRTRAKYLVPHNPKNVSEIDYEFGSKTKNSSFRDLYWNKIYSVSNFISRFQRNNILDQLTSIGRTRATTAIKDVDDCVGDKTPFPYNRVNTNINPIFSILCLIIKIISFLIYILNRIIIPVINLALSIINGVLQVICNIIVGIGDIVCAIPGTGDDCESSFCTGNWNGSSCNCSNIIPYVGCVSVKCPTDDGSYFAPGCSTGGIDGGKSFNASNPSPTYYENDNSGHSGPFDTGLDNCVAFEMAKALNLFQFDFYNDWINGTLFSFLLKYKKKKRGREVFCEYDCDDFGIAAGGSDGNKNGIPDNDCLNSVLIDSCFKDDDDIEESRNIREGVIKKIGKEFFYAASTHNADLKLFATEVINLGSVFDCDWQGVLKTQSLLIPTTYKVPPDIQELGEDGTTKITCGMVNIGGNTTGLFFNIDCLGVHLENNSMFPLYSSNGKGSLNIRHICEFGVDIDQAQEDPATGIIIQPSDCIIGFNEINDNGGKFFRDGFYALNFNGPNVPDFINTLLPLPANGYATDFNINNISFYNFAGLGDNGLDYLNFRGIPYNDNHSYRQTNHSYFFYFGLQPGKTALDKMNQRFFTTCTPKQNIDIIIQAIPTNVTTFSGNNGTITFTIIGGTGPYQYSIFGINGTNYQLPITGTLTSPNAGPITITGLYAGTYVINIVDAFGNPASQTVVVSDPPSLYCSVSVTKNSTTSSSNNGEISINGVGGGFATGGYSYTALTSGGTFVSSGVISQIPLQLTSLPADGYSVIISDSSTPPQLCITTGLTVGGPVALSVTSNKVDVTCFGGNNGAYSLTINGGQPPYSIVTTGPSSFTSGLLNNTNLKLGTYSTTVTDSLNQIATTSKTLSELNPLLTLTSGNVAELYKQCDPTKTTITLYITNGVSNGSNVTFNYTVDSTSNFTVTKTFVDSSTPILIDITQPITSGVKVTFTNANGCSSNIVSIFKSAITLPTTPLSLNVTGVNNAKQCSTGVTNTSFNIVGGKGGPYTISWFLSSLPNGAGITGSPQTTTSNSTQPVLTNTQSLSITNVHINILVTEASGCQAFLSIPYPVRPTVPLNVSITTTGGPTYNHAWSGVGGFAPYVGVPSNNPYIDLNPTFTITVTDGVGCTVTKTG